MRFSSMTPLQISVPLKHVKMAHDPAMEKQPASALPQEQEGYYHFGNHAYYAEKCPKCEEFKKKANHLKQILLGNKCQPDACSSCFPMWNLTEEEPSASANPALELKCYECEENEAALEWYRSLYRTSRQWTQTRL